MVRAVATLELASGTRGAFIAEFAEVVPLLHAEAACIEDVRPWMRKQAPRWLARDLRRRTWGSMSMTCNQRRGNP